MKYSYFLILFILSCTPPLPQEENNQLSECNAPYGYDCGDISVLQKFIEINSSPEIFRHYMDYNENDILEPIEFGFQVWDEGRLVQLNLNYNENIIMKADNPSELDPTNYRLTQIPDNIIALDSLEGLWLHDNEFTYVPDSIGNLSQLKIIDFENNLLTELPDLIGNLVNLERLVLSYNQLISLPTSIGNLTSLKKLWLQNNKLDSIPESLGSLHQLEWLYCNNNFLTSVPASIGQLNQLEFLNLDYNNLLSLPEDLCDIYFALVSFSIGQNYLCDSNAIPSCIGEDIGSQTCANCPPHYFKAGSPQVCVYEYDYNILQNFLDMNLESQSLPSQTGIPDNANECINVDWWDNGRLVEITFQSKQLTSIIPESIGDLDKLKILRLTGNYLKGEIPENIINLSELEELKLNSNNLSGSIPSDIGNLINLDTLWLNNNTLGCYDYDYDCDPFGRKSNCCIIHCDHTDMCNAELPESITNLGRLQHLKLNNNMLSGIIPVNIGDIDSLKYLYLDNNFLSGSIPYTIGNLTKLRRLYLLNNDLTSEVPRSICNLYHHPDGFKLYLHNNNLCPGELGYPTCIPDEDLGLQTHSECSR